MEKCNHLLSQLFLSTAVSAMPEDFRLPPQGPPAGSQHAGLEGKLGTPASGDVVATRGEATSKVFARIQLTDGGENLRRGKQAAVTAPSWGQELPGSFPHPMKLWDAEVLPRITCWREQILLQHKPCSASQGCWGAQRVGTERHGKKPRAQRASPGQGHCKSTLVEEPRNTSGNPHFALPFCRHAGRGDLCRNPSSVGH